jgi:hypothetical protein
MKPHTILLLGGIVTNIVANKDRAKILGTSRITRVAGGSCGNPGFVSNPIPPKGTGSKGFRQPIDCARRCSYSLPRIR